MRNRENHFIKTLLIAVITLLVGCTYEVDPEVEGDNMPLPQYIDSWSASGSIRAGLTGQEGEAAVKLQALFDNSKHGAGLYNVQFNVRLPNNLPADSLINTKAVVVWSTKGNSVRRKVSIFNGASISGSASSVAVEVRDSSTGTIQTDYQVSILVTPGTRASQDQPPILLEGGGGTVLAGATGIVDIPQDCGIISVNPLVGTSPSGGAIADTEVTIEQIISTGLINSRWLPLKHPGFVPISPVAKQLRIRNSSGALTIAWTPIWGIDG